jgi:hypothetical protein
MNKLKAIWKIIKSEHFYLITADKYLLCSETRSNKTDYTTISKMIQLVWVSFWKGVFISNVKDGEKYV